MAEAARRELCDDAMTMLVLWATKQDYDPAVEALLTEWASILGVPQDQLTDKVNRAMGASLQRPVLRRYASVGAAPPRGSGGGGAGATAAAAAGPLAAAYPAGPAPAAARPGGGGGSSGVKRPPPAGGGGGSAKKAKVATAGDLAVFAGVTKLEAMVGRKVKRYWPADAAKNRGDPWFTAVVTDYDPTTRTHVLTYSLGTQKEEREDVNISTLHQGSIDFTSDWVPLEKWYADPKKSDKSYAVKISKYLRARQAGVC